MENRSISGVMGMGKFKFEETNMKIGRILKNPETNRYVQIIDGAVWMDGEYADWWWWREVKADGTLGRLEAGNGW